MICHGQGDQRVDTLDGGCCFVAGQVCPNRWFIDWTGVAAVADAIVRDHTGASLGTVDAVARSFVGGNPNRRQQIYDEVQGTLFLCAAAIQAIAVDPNIRNNRATFDAAWAARAEYQPIADAWELIGRPRNWCQLFGPPEGQCCFGEDQATNDTRAAALSVTAVTVRRGAQGAN